jgi:hypothetical protein
MAQPLPVFDLDDTVESIKNAGCVLLAGPELLRYRGQPVHRYLREQLLELAKPGDIELYYEQESLFLFSGTSARIRVKKKAKEWLRNLWADPEFQEENRETLRLLAQLPVHLVISTTPDKFLSASLAAYHIPHQTGFFVGGNKEVRKVAAPAMHKPLVYNLCGSVDDHESIILDYEDLYKYMKSVLDAGRLPKGLTDALCDADKFIFLGFELEKWHTQMLIQLLTEILENREKFASKPNYATADFKRFFEGHFKMAPLDWAEQDDFLRDLLAAFQSEHPQLVRRTDREYDSRLAFVRQYVEENDFINALHELEAAADSTDDKNAVSLLKSRCHEFAERQDSMHPDTRNAERNKLSADILALATDILRGL